MKQSIWRRALLCVSTGLLGIAATGNGYAAADGTVTFYKDMLPIFQQDCQVCHRPGQIAPFSMLSYDDTRPYAKSIKRLVMKREMPPWFADPSVGHFANDPSLSDEKINLIAKWVDGGAVAGKPSDAPKPVAWAKDGWVIPPDIVVQGGEYPVPKDGVVDWQYIVMPSGFTKDTWVSSMEMRPGVDPSVTHHYCVWIVPKIKNVTYNKALKSQYELGVGGDGFDGCYEPGQGPFDYRQYQAGRLIEANSDVIFQMHYVPKGKHAVVDKPKIGFTVAKSKPPRQFVFQNVGAGLKIDIPPNDANYKAPLQEGELTVDTKIVWLQGHAHYRAKEMHFTIAYPDGRVERALQINWDPNWQQLYYPTKPIVAPKGTILQIEGWYDNSKRNRLNPDANARVPFGLQGTEEMLFPTFGFLIDVPFDTKTQRPVKPSSRADESFTVTDKEATAAKPTSPVAAR